VITPRSRVPDKPETTKSSFINGTVSDVQ
jgi:hypothetical protein